MKKKFYICICFIFLLINNTQAGWSENFGNINLPSLGSMASDYGISDDIISGVTGSVGLGIKLDKIKDRIKKGECFSTAKVFHELGLSSSSDIPAYVHQAINLLSLAEYCNGDDALGFDVGSYKSPGEPAPSGTIGPMTAMKGNEDCQNTDGSLTMFCTPKYGKNNDLTDKEFIKQEMSNTNISTEENLIKLIMGWLNFALVIISLISILAIIWAGVQYITAMGDDSKTESAKKIVTWVIIGLLLIMGAYAIVYTVLTFNPLGTKY